MCFFWIQKVAVCEAFLFKKKNKNLCIFEDIQNVLISLYLDWLTNTLFGKNCVASPHKELLVKII